MDDFLVFVLAVICLFIGAFVAGAFVFTKCPACPQAQAEVGSALFNSSEVRSSLPSGNVNKTYSMRAIPLTVLDENGFCLEYRDGVGNERPCNESGHPVKPLEVCEGCIGNATDKFGSGSIYSVSAVGTETAQLGNCVGIMYSRGAENSFNDSTGGYFAPSMVVSNASGVFVPWETVKKAMPENWLNASCEHSYGVVLNWGE